MIEVLAFIIVFFAAIRLARRKLRIPNYHGQTVWITGASSGIGQALAYEFNRYGAFTIISARNQKELERVKSESPNPSKVMVVRMDMTEYDQVRSITENVIKDLEKRNEKIDVIVENAGVSMRSPMKDYPFENHVALFDVNLNGPFNHLQVIAKHMIGYKTGQIVGISSVAGKLSMGDRTSYAGSKRALIGLLDVLRIQLEPFGISVTNIMPGYIRTNLSNNALSSQPGEKFGRTDKNIENGMDVSKFAREAVKAIFNKEKQTQIGEIWWMPIAILMRTVMPDLLFHGLKKKYQSGLRAEAAAGKRD